MLAPLLAAAGALAADPPLPYPHPLITEVLFDVPRDADPSQDGARQVAGDEFVEVFNPHDRPISLKGYTLTDKNPPGRGQFKFVFPDLTLKPGQVAVVFNGHDQRWSGPVGDSNVVPSEPHPKFNRAFVLTARNRNSMAAFGNDGDYILLTSPKGEPLHAITWGDTDAPPKATKLVEQAPKPRSGSVQRESTTGRLVEHSKLNGLPYSPGQFPLGAMQSEEEQKPAETAEDPAPEPRPERKPETRKPARPPPRENPPR